jgi:hypothetical protein
MLTYWRLSHVKTLRQIVVWKDVSSGSQTHTKLHFLGTYTNTPRIDTQTHRHTDTQTHRHTDTQIHRHTDTQTYRHTDTQTHTEENTMVVGRPKKKSQFLEHRRTPTSPRDASVLQTHTNTIQPLSDHKSRTRGKRGWIEDSRHQCSVITATTHHRRHCHTNFTRCEAL